MTRSEKFLRRILRGDADTDIRFEELVGLLEHLGFQKRVKGDHHIFTKAGVIEILNLQPRGGKAKPYQVKQVRSVLTMYGLASGSTGEECDE